jgi:hypothetical protein
MVEFKVEIPGSLKDESKRIEREVEELISLEEKRKLLSKFIDEVMKGAKQLTEDKLVEFGREIKNGRFHKLKQIGLL